MFGEDGVMRGEDVKTGKGRVKAQLFESEVREMTKGNAVQYWCSDVSNIYIYNIYIYISLKSVMTTD